MVVTELSSDRLVGVVNELVNSSPRFVSVSIAVDGTCYSVALSGERHQRGPLNPHIQPVKSKREDEKLEPPEVFRRILKDKTPNGYLCGGVVKYDNEYTTNGQLMGHIHLIKVVDPSTSWIHNT